MSDLTVKNAPGVELEPTGNKKMTIELAKITYIKTSLSLRDISNMSGFSIPYLTSKSKLEKWSFLKKEYKSELEQKYKWLLEVEHKEYSRKFYELARVKACQMLGECTTPYNLQLIVKAFTDADNSLVALRITDLDGANKVEDKQEGFLLSLAML